MSDEKGVYQIGTLGGVILRANVCGSDANVLRAMFKGLQASAEANRWISVAERVPDTTRDVLVVRDNRVRVDAYLPTSQPPQWMDEGIGSVVTHWREQLATPAQMDRQAAEILGGKEA